MGVSNNISIRRILWALANYGGKLERSRLRARSGCDICGPKPILEEMVKEGRIKMTAGKQGNIVSLISG